MDERSGLACREIMEAEMFGYEMVLKAVTEKGNHD